MIAHLFTVMCHRWQPKESPESQADYVMALQDSDLTLHPVGVNSECYRVYEALSFGSVPVIEDIMTPGSCGSNSREPNSTLPPAPLRLLKEFNAPVIYVKKWTELTSILRTELLRSHEEVIERRRKVLEWYSYFQKKMKKLFLDTLEKHFQIVSDVR